MMNSNNQIRVPVQKEYMKYTNLNGRMNLKQTNLEKSYNIFKKSVKNRPQSILKTEEYPYKLMSGDSRIVKVADQSYLKDVALGQPPEVTTERLKQLHKKLDNVKNVQTLNFMKIVNRDAIENYPEFFNDEEYCKNTMENQRQQKSIVSNPNDTSSNVHHNSMCQLKFLTQKNIDGKCLNAPVNKNKFAKVFEYGTSKGLFSKEELIPSTRTMHDKLISIKSGKIDSARLKTDSDNYLDPKSHYSDSYMKFNSKKTLQQRKNDSVLEPRNRINSNMFSNGNFTERTGSKLPSISSKGFLGQNLKTDRSSATISQHQPTFNSIWENTNGIFPEWLLRRNDFRRSLNDRSIIKKGKISVILLKPIEQRTNEEKLYVINWLISSNLFPQYNREFLELFALRLEPQFFMKNQILAYNKFSDPICILIEGEVENIATKKNVKRVNLIWDVRSNFDEITTLQNFYFKKNGVIIKMSGLDFK